MSYPLAFFNGQFLPYADIAFVPDDAGLVWGATVTDRLRTFGGRPFALDAHLRRFRQSCNLARVPQPVADGKLGRVTEQLVRENRDGGELSVVWVATPGPFPGAAPIDFAERAPSLLAYTLPLDPTRFARHYRDGFRLIPVAAPLGVDPRVKHRSRLPWWIARQEVQALDPDAEPLVIDLPNEAVLETPSANLLAAIDGVVVTPPRDRVLNGVSLSVVEELCGQLGIPFARAPLTLTDLARASEVLLASTPYCVAGVSKLGGQDVPFPGPIRDRLLDAWSGLVGVNVRAQMGPQ
jgi:branched-subunit amino acid aminotransferase/4-amino-4-deoxychorismate lyase